MIFVDANVPMYLVGGDDAYKRRSRGLLERAAADGDALVTDAEVLQEILRRYVSIHRLDAVEPAMRSIIEIVDQVFPIERTDVEAARDIVLGARLSARNAIHIAVMRRRGVDRIMTFDRGFDHVPRIARISD